MVPAAFEPILLEAKKDGTYDEIRGCESMFKCKRQIKSSARQRPMNLSRYHRVRREKRLPGETLLDACPEISTSEESKRAWDPTTDEESS